MSAADPVAADTEVMPQQRDAGEGRTALAPRAHEGREGPALWRRRTLAPVVTLVALLAIPLIVALTVLAEPRWYPVLDMAQTELRIRDVASADPPLIGLAGRIGPLGEQGSHPGPLSFWALWPFYQLFGASSWALQAAAASLHLLASAAILWIAHRRGGIALLLGTAAVLAVLMRAYGAGTLTEPWNPYLPVLWWLVFLLAAWSLGRGDVRLAPLVVVAGSFCAQTHVPYLGLVAGLTALTTVAVLVQLRRGSPEGRRRATRWLLVAAGAAVILWLPPVIDQLTSDDGNISKLLDHFGDPPEPAIGLREAVELTLVHLNPGRLVAADLVDSRFADPSLVPGLAFLAVWAASVVVALRRRHGPVVWLDLVLAAALVLGLVTMSRIFGYVWFYLTFWAWGTTALMVVAIGWTVVVVVGDHLTHDRRARLRPLAVGGLGGVVLLSTAAFAVDARGVEITDAHESEVLAALVPPTVEALEDGGVPGGGRDGRYLVDFEIDPIAIGSLGFGMVNELERDGFDVGAPEFHNAGATRHRVLDPAEATGVVHVAVGPDIDAWRAKPEVEEVAFVEPRTRAEREEYERLRTDVVTKLSDAGLQDLADQAQQVLFVAALDPRLPQPLHEEVLRMLELGLPAAVFVGPASSVS